MDAGTLPYSCLKVCAAYFWSVLGDVAHDR